VGEGRGGGSKGHTVDACAHRVGLGVRGRKGLVASGEGGPRLVGTCGGALEVSAQGGTLSACGGEVASEVALGGVHVAELCVEGRTLAAEGGARVGELALGEGMRLLQSGKLGRQCVRLREAKEIPTRCGRKARAMQEREDDPLFFRIPPPSSRPCLKIVLRGETAGPNIHGKLELAFLLSPCLATPHSFPTTHSRHASRGQRHAHERHRG